MQQQQQQTRMASFSHPPPSNPPTPPSQMFPTPPPQPSYGAIPRSQNAMPSPPSPVQPQGINTYGSYPSSPPPFISTPPQENALSYAPQGLFNYQAQPQQVPITQQPYYGTPPPLPPAPFQLQSGTMVYTTQQSTSMSGSPPPTPPTHFQSQTGPADTGGRKKRGSSPPLNKIQRIVNEYVESLRDETKIILECREYLIKEVIPIFRSIPGVNQIVYI